MRKKDKAMKERWWSKKEYSNEEEDCVKIDLREAEVNRREMAGSRETWERMEDSKSRNSKANTQRNEMMHDNCEKKNYIEF